MHDENPPEVDAVASFGLPSDVDPTLEGKVDALRTVESEVEAGMVPSRESDYELALLLHKVVWPARSFREHVRRREVRLMPQELGTILACAGEQTCTRVRISCVDTAKDATNPSSSAPKRSPVLAAWRTRTCGGTKVDVVDAEQIHVFDMPRKCCPPHAKVQIWCVDSRQAFR